MEFFEEDGDDEEFPILIVENPCETYDNKRFKPSISIEFDNDDILEDFCQKYGFLEPDEQPREIQDASTGIIEKRNWKDLYNYLNCPDILNTLDDTFQYLY